MKFDASIVGGKAPRDGTLMGIALGLQGGNTLLQDVHALHPGDKQPRAKIAISISAMLSRVSMFGRVMELDALQDAPCFSRAV